MEQQLLEEPPGNTIRWEILEGPTGRRSWPGDVKGRIVVSVDEPMFARLEIAPQDEAVPEPPTNGFVEIGTTGIIIRLPGDCTAARIADVVSALSTGR